MYVSQRHQTWVAHHVTAAPRNHSDHKEVTVLLRAPRLAAPTRKTPALYSVPDAMTDEFHGNLWPRIERLAIKLESCTTADFDWDRIVMRIQRAVTATKTELFERDRHRWQAAKRQRNRQLHALPELDAMRAETLDHVHHLDNQRAAGQGEAMRRGISATTDLYGRVTAREWEQGISRLESAEHDFADDASIAQCLRKTWEPFLQARPTRLSAFPFSISEDRQLPGSVGNALLAPIEEGEVLQVIHGLARQKRAGPDGLPNDFYRDFGTLLASALARVYNNILRGAACPPSFGEALIFPIRKNGDSPNPKDYRPISLLNSSYKIFARLLARRLAPGLRTVVGEVQNGFVKGRHIDHSINVMQAALLLQRDDGPAPTPDSTPCIVLLDFAKAYDTVDRQFLYSVLTKMHFPPDFVRVVTSMHHGTSARFIANGAYSDAFPVERGIRQGCPLAAFLFLLVMEPLAQAFQAQAKDIGFQFSVEHQEHFRSFSGFVDDSALFLNEARHLAAALRLLDSFGQASGLQVNKQKSHGIWLHAKQLSAVYSGIPFLGPNDTTRYLGVQVGLGDLRAVNWEYRRRKLLARLWFAVRRELALLDRATVIRSIALPSVLFTARFFVPPPAVIHHIQRLLTRFLWRGITRQEGASTRAPIASEIASLPFDEGGINVPNLAHAVQEQAYKRVLHWSVASPNANLLVMDLLLPGIPLVITTGHVHRSCRPYTQMHPKIPRHFSLHAKSATVWTIGAGQVAFAQAVEWRPPPGWLSEVQRWLRTLGQGTHVAARFEVTGVYGSYIFSEWHTTWMKHCDHALTAQPLGVHQFLCDLNLVDNPWFIDAAGDRLRASVFRAGPCVTATQLLHLERTNGGVHWRLTDFGVQCIKRFPEQQRSGALDYWIRLLVANCPRDRWTHPQQLAASTATPPFDATEFRLVGPEKLRIQLLGPGDTWTVALPGYNDRLPAPHRPLTLQQDVFVAAATTNHLQLRHHPETTRLLPTALDDATSERRRFATLWRHHKHAARARNRKRGRLLLERRLDSWTQRDVAIARLLGEQEFTRIWTERVPFTARDSEFRYKVKIGALNTGRDLHGGERVCPLASCVQRQPDTLAHVFWECDAARAVWRRVLQVWTRRPCGRSQLRRWQRSIFTEVNPRVPAELRTAMGQHFRRSCVQTIWRLLVRTTLQALWRARNDEVHSGCAHHPRAVYHQATQAFLQRLRAFAAACGSRKHRTQRVDALCHLNNYIPTLSFAHYWTQGEYDCLELRDDRALPDTTYGHVLFYDGGSRGNPAPGAGGAVLVQLAASATTILWYGCVFLPTRTTTNNTAEYEGLIIGVEAALAHGVRRLAIVGDSALLRQQLLGRFRTRGKLRPYRARALDLLDRMDDYTLVHHRREFNKQADYMANFGMDAGVSITSRAPPQHQSPSLDRLRAHCATDVAHYLTLQTPAHQSATKFSVAEVVTAALSDKSGQAADQKG